MSTKTGRKDVVVIDPYVTQDKNWQPDIDYYSNFIREATGLSVPDSLSPHDCYRIGNLLQGFIEEMKTEGDWNAKGISSYPVVESTDEAFYLSEFFRDCHAREMCDIEG